MLRLFEIPFSTFDCEDFRFVFVAMHAVATLYAPKEFSAYADLEDTNFDQLRDEINSKNSEDNSANVVMFHRRSCHTLDCHRSADNGSFWQKRECLY